VRNNGSTKDNLTPFSVQYGFKYLGEGHPGGDDRQPGTCAHRGERNRGFRDSLEPLGLFLRTSIPFINMAYSGCLPTRLNPLAERTCLSQAHTALANVTFDVEMSKVAEIDQSSGQQVVALDVKVILTPPCIFH
jgi:hypothetical protein